jgi:hypothetical protein
MRRSRRGGHAALEFGGSGEDSFVAVVVTKLTGALLFILLLTMVIMALLPKAVDLPPSESSASKSAPRPLAIVTPPVLPEAIVDHPYAVALAATGGGSTLEWSLDGTLPDGLTFDSASAQIRGTPRVGTAKPAELLLRVSDGTDRAAQAARLVVYESDRPLSTPSRWKPGLPPIPWRAWLEHGFGFLVLWLVHLVGMNTLGNLRRRSLDAVAAEGDDEEARGVRRRFMAYRMVVRLASLTAGAALAVWLWQQRGA